MQTMDRVGRGRSRVFYRVDRTRCGIISRLCGNVFALRIHRSNIVIHQLMA